MPSASEFIPRRWVTVAQFCELPEFRDAFTVAALRHHIFQAESRSNSRGEVVAGNGLAEAGALIRLGRKVLIDVDQFGAWLDAHRIADHSQAGVAGDQKNRVHDAQPRKVGK